MRKYVFLSVSACYFVAPLAVFAANDEELEADSNIIINILTTQPPPLLINTALLIAGITLFWRIFVYFADRGDKRRDTKANVHSDYWFSSILMPICIEPLVKFVFKSADRMFTLNADTSGEDAEVIRISYNEFLASFKQERSDITSRCLIIASVSPDLYKSVTTKLDVIDDILTQHCYIKSNGGQSADERRMGEALFVREQIIYSLNDILDSIYNCYKHMRLT